MNRKREVPGASRRRNFYIAALLISSACLRGTLCAQAPAADDPFKVFETCKLSQDLSVVDAAPLAAGVQTRPVPTREGNRIIPMLAGRRLMFAYPGEDFYANLKVETLPADGWAESRTVLQNNFDYVLASGDDLRNYKLKPQIHGFDVEGQDRAKREGGALGLYLVLDDATHTAVTTYFLNQEPPVRFKTMQEYAVLRDRFLEEYTKCVRGQIRQPSR